MDIYIKHCFCLVRLGLELLLHVQQLLLNLVDHHLGNGQRSGAGRRGRIPHVEHARGKRPCALVKDEIVDQIT